MTAQLPPGQIVTLNGMQMYYVLHGEGEPLLLLHGHTGSSEDWTLFFDDLAREYRLIIPDLRGHGRSTNPSREFTFRQVALDVLALLDYLGIERFKAVGLSLGGNALLHMATRQPGRVEAMVLVSAASYYPEQARQFMRDYTIDNLPEAERQRLRQAHKHGEEQIQELLRHGQSFQNTYDDMNFTPPYLSTISARTLIVYGDRDPLLPVTIALEQYIAIPRSYLWVVPNGGHVPIFSGTAFMEAVAQFLRGEWERN